MIGVIGEIGVIGLVVRMRVAGELVAVVRSDVALSVVLVVVTISTAQRWVILRWKLEGGSSGRVGNRRVGNRRLGGCRRCRIGFGNERIHLDDFGRIRRRMARRVVVVGLRRSRLAMEAGVLRLL